MWKNNYDTVKKHFVYFDALGAKRIEPVNINKLEVTTFWNLNSVFIVVIFNRGKAPIFAAMSLV